MISSGLYITQVPEPKADVRSFLRDHALKYFHMLLNYVHATLIPASGKTFRDAACLLLHK